MSEFSSESPSSEQKARPRLLIVLVVLSLMYIANGLFTSIIGLMFGPLSPDDIQKVINLNMDQVNQFYEMGQPYWGDVSMKILNIITYTNANFYIDKVINLVGFGIGLIGVVSMLRGFRIGFHLYIIYSLIVTFGVYASAPMSEIPGFYLGFYVVTSLLFIYLYSKILPWMSK